MQCQICNKPATVHLTEIVNGDKIERHLCEQCAQNEGITIKTHVPLNELLNNIVSAQEQADELADLCCPQCDLSWADFRKAGQLGCPNDYLAFERPLRNLIERAHEGANKHVGRVPRHADGKTVNQVKMRRLRQELQKAVDMEDYETAARIRDEMQNLN